MSSEFKLSDQTSVALLIKNIVAIVSAIVVEVDKHGIKRIKEVKQD